MLFETALLGLAYYVSKAVEEDGPLVHKVMALFDTVKAELFDLPRSPVGTVAKVQPQPVQEKQAAVAIHTHFQEVSLVSTGALLLRRAVPLAGLVGFVGYAYTLAPHLRAVEQNLRKNRSLNVDTLFLLADVLTFLSGSYAAAAFSQWLIQKGNLGIARAKDQSRKHVQHLFRDLPGVIWLLRDGAEVGVALASVQQGDVVVLHGGEVIPVDGVILEGQAAVDQQVLTGEAQLAEKGPGDSVFANTVLISGRIVVHVERSGAETTANQIADILLRSITCKSQTQLKGETWADTMTRPMFYAALALLPIVGPETTAVFINSHIGMRIRILAPMGTLKHISMASKRGLLVKDGRALERFLEVDTILFDKTGTLTYENPEVGSIVTCGTYTDDEVLRYAAIAEQKVAHPIAKAIVARARELGLRLPDIDDSCYTIGYGIEVICKGERIRVGSLRYLEGEAVPVAESWRMLQQVGQQVGQSFVFVAVDARIIGALHLQARTRLETAEVIARLRQQGVQHMAIVSGDRDGPTRLLAAELGMNMYYANVLPQQKADIVSTLQAQGRKVCFVGDGINDSLALKRADVSISLAGATTIAQDMADVVLMDGHIGSLNELHALSCALDENLKRSLRLSVAPGVINLLGAFALEFSSMTSLLVNATFAVVAASYVAPSQDDGEQPPSAPRTMGAELHDPPPMALQTMTTGKATLGV